jgi:hypothetical protein
MKNYNFVLGAAIYLLLNSVQAATATADIKTNRMAPSMSPPALQSPVTPVATSHVPVPTVLKTGNAAHERKVFPFDELVTNKALPQAFHFLDGSKGATQEKRAASKLEQVADARRDVSEPASEVLLLVALSALAIAVRRQSPS